MICVHSRVRPLKQALSFAFLVALLTALLAPLYAQSQNAPPAQPVTPPAAQTLPPAAPQRVRPIDAAAPLPDCAAMLRGAYGPFRANNDLLYYHLSVRVDPEKKLLKGKNTIRFRMLKDGTRIQLDLQEPLDIDKISTAQPSSSTSATPERRLHRLPGTLRAGQSIPSTSTTPATRAPPAASAASPSKPIPPALWINTACEGIGASIWWPNKDQWRDEVENMDLSVEIPNNLTDVSNGKFSARPTWATATRAGTGTFYPINNYDVSLNIGDYVHFGDRLGDVPLDFYALPADLDKAKTQFAQAKGMLEAYQHYFGEYPFAKDGHNSSKPPTPAWSTRAPPPTATFRERLPRPRLDRGRHQPPLRLHHHSRERPRVVR